MQPARAVGIGTGVGGVITEGSLGGLGVKELGVKKRLQVFRWGWSPVGLGRRKGPWPGGWVEWTRKVIPEDELALENLLGRRGVKVWLVKAEQVYPDSQPVREGWGGG